MEFVTNIFSHLDTITAAVVGVLSGVIVICTFIPGDQPEKALQGVVDWIAKYSKKPAA